MIGFVVYYRTDVDTCITYNSLSRYSSFAAAASALSSYLSLLPSSYIVDDCEFQDFR